MSKSTVDTSLVSWGSCEFIGLYSPTVYIYGEEDSIHDPELARYTLVNPCHNFDGEDDAHERAKNDAQHAAACVDLCDCPDEKSRAFYQSLLHSGYDFLENIMNLQQSTYYH